MDDGFEEEDEVIYDKTSLLQRRPPRRTGRPSGENDRKAHICRLVSVALVFVCLGISLAIPGPTLRCFEYLTHSEEHLVSCLFVGRAGGILIASLSTQLLLDFMPADCLSVTGLLLLAVAHFVIPWSERIWWLVGAFALQGAAIGLVLSGGLALTRLLYGARHISLRHFFLLAMAFGSLLTPFLVMPFQADELTTPASYPMTRNATSPLVRLPRQVVVEGLSGSIKRGGVGEPPPEEDSSEITDNSDLHRGGAVFPLTPASPETVAPVKSSASTRSSLARSSPTTSPSAAVPPKPLTNKTSNPSISIFHQSSLAVNTSESLESDEKSRGPVRVVESGSRSTFQDEDNLPSSTADKPESNSTLSTTTSTSSTSTSTPSISTTIVNASSISPLIPAGSVNNASSSISPLIPAVSVNNASSSISPPIPAGSVNNASSISPPIPAGSVNNASSYISPLIPEVSVNNASTSISPPLPAVSVNNASTTTTTSSSTSTITTTTTTTTTSSSATTTTTSSTSTTPASRQTAPGRRKPSLNERYHHIVNRISALRPVQRIYLSLGALCLFVCLISLHLCCACRRVPRFPVTAEPTAVFGQRRFTGSDLVFIAAVLLLSMALAGLEVTLGNYLFAWARRETPAWTTLGALMLTAAFWLGLVLGRLSLLVTGRCGGRLALLLFLHLALLLAAGVVLAWLGSRRTALGVGVAVAGWGLGPARTLLALWLEAAGMKGAELRWMTTLSSVAAGAGEAVLPPVAAFAHQVRVLSLVCGSAGLACFLTAVGLMRWRIGARGRPQEEDEELLAAAAADSDDPEDGTFALRKLRDDGGKTNGDTRRQRLVDMEEDELDLH